MDSWQPGFGFRGFPEPQEQISWIPSLGAPQAKKNELERADFKERAVQANPSKSGPILHGAAGEENFGHLGSFQKGFSPQAADDWLCGLFVDLRIRILRIRAFADLQIRIPRILGRADSDSEDSGTRGFGFRGFWDPRIRIPRIPGPVDSDSESWPPPTRNTGAPAQTQERQRWVQSRTT